MNNRCNNIVVSFDILTSLSKNKSFFKMKTFSKQDELPSLPVPDLNNSLNRYLRSARALTNDQDYNRTVSQVEEFRNSALAKQMQDALVSKSKLERNWLEDWWYDAYLTIREPLAPFLSIVAANSYYKPVPGSQISRACDVAHHWMSFWNKIRLESLPITRSRNAVWDMYQYKCLFNSVRIPGLPKDKMVRYFTDDLVAPSHIIVFCCGNAWKIEMMNSEGGELRTPEEIYYEMKWIREHSKPQSRSVISLTTGHRDVWAKQRVKLLDISGNKEALHDVESAAFCITLVDEEISSVNEILERGMISNHQNSWLDKNLNLMVFNDGQMIMQGDHSNVDAIVMIHCGDVAATRIRKEVWTPKEVKGTPPKSVRFVLNKELESDVDQAALSYENLKNSFRCEVVKYMGYGNSFLKKNKLYTDTIIQLALQLAFLKTHGSFAPIYETASTRKFFHGRTETVRGCTLEMVKFGKAILNGEKNCVLHDLFMKAYDSHNNLMEEATNGEGFDRHMFGLRNILETFNKGCSPKQSLPKFLKDSVWSQTGGDGNFLLSTSFCGYMTDEEDGGFGYVCAMRKDGYGIFYRIANNRFCFVVTDWVESKSNIDGMSKNIIWAMDKIQTVVDGKSSL